MPVSDEVSYYGSGNISFRFDLTCDKDFEVATSAYQSLYPGTPRAAAAGTLARGYSALRRYAVLRFPSGATEAEANFRPWRYS